MLLWSGNAIAQTYEQYVHAWSGKDRARLVTYRFDQPHLDLKGAGYVSDRPLEWSKNLGLEGDNRLVDPFEVGPRAKHVLLMVHGYGGVEGAYVDRDD